MWSLYQKRQTLFRRIRWMDLSEDLDDIMLSAMIFLDVYWNIWMPFVHLQMSWTVSQIDFEFSLYQDLESFEHIIGLNCEKVELFDVFRLNSVGSEGRIGFQRAMWQIPLFSEQKKLKKTDILMIMRFSRHHEDLGSYALKTFEWSIIIRKNMRFFENFYIMVCDSRKVSGPFGTPCMSTNVRLSSYLLLFSVNADCSNIFKSRSQIK